jgi:hypothetical protein
VTLQSPANDIGRNTHEITCADGRSAPAAVRVDVTLAAVEALGGWRLSAGWPAVTLGRGFVVRRAAVFLGGRVRLAVEGERTQMQRPTDDQIMRALCCGGECVVGPFTTHCHRWDFVNEMARIRALLEQAGHEEQQRRNDCSGA